MAEDTQKPPAAGVSIKFVGDAIYKAIKELETNQRRLSPEAGKARDAVQDAIKRLEDVSKAIESRCLPTWFLAPK
jgi:hypothetical protein